MKYIVTKEVIVSYYVDAVDSQDALEKTNDDFDYIMKEENTISTKITPIEGGDTECQN